MSAVLTASNVEALNHDDSASSNAGTAPATPRSMPPATPRSIPPPTPRSVAGDPSSSAAAANATAKAAKAANKPAAKPKKGRVQIQDERGGEADGDGGYRKQAQELQRMLHEANDEMAKRDRAQAKLEQQLQEANSKASDLMRTGARRLLQIATLERELDAERTKGKRMLDELVKQTKMMDLVINFRDQECARDVNELTHDNLELSEKLDLWKDRAQMLQEERWGFVQKFRAAKSEAKAQAGAKGEKAFDGVGTDVDPDLESDEDEGEEEGDKDDADSDW